MYESFCCISRAFIPINILSSNVHQVCLCKAVCVWVGRARKTAGPISRSNKAFGKISSEIQTSVNGKSARLCCFPGQLKHKHLYEGFLFFVRTYTYKYLSSNFHKVCVRGSSGALFVSINILSVRVHQVQRHESACIINVNKLCACIHVRMYTLSRVTYTLIDAQNHLHMYVHTYPYYDISLHTTYCKHQTIITTSQTRYHEKTYRFSFPHYAKQDTSFFWPTPNLAYTCITCRSHNQHTHTIAHTEYRPEIQISHAYNSRETKALRSHVHGCSIQVDQYDA